MSLRVNLDNKATHRLHALKSKTGLTPNILSRLSIMLSLKERVIPDYDRYDTKGMEMNRNTLMGDFDEFIIGLVTVWMMDIGLEINEETVRKTLVYHINNGVIKLKSVIKDDLLDLFEYSN